MKKPYLLIAIALAVAACEGVPSGTTPGGNTNAGGNGGGQATINLTVSGALQGSSTQLNKSDCTGLQYGSFAENFSPVINGKEYDLGMLLSAKSSPTTIDLSTPDNHVLVELNDLKTGTGGWRTTSDTTGTFTIDAGGNSGSADLHNLSNLLPGAYATTIDLKMTFSCPVK
ncbi:MAG TPA: hypothetical protein VEW68_06440 [Patescibacteria group bacterium]|nr:hypothetical protein [Patescibacteria group bacterium]